MFYGLYVSHGMGEGGFIAHFKAELSYRKSSVQFQSPHGEEGLNVPLVVQLAGTSKKIS